MSRPEGVATFLESLRTVAGTGIAIIHTRIQLLGAELEAELRRARNLLVLTHAVLLTLLLTIGFAGCALIATFWDSHRLLASWLVVGVFATLSLLALTMLIRTVHAKPLPFAATLRQLEQDLAALRRRT